MMMLMIRKKLSHRCFWWNIDCCARGGLFQAIPEDGDGDDDDETVMMVTGMILLMTLMLMMMMTKISNYMSCTTQDCEDDVDN